MNKSSKFHRLMQILAMFLCVAMVAGTLGTANAVKAASAPANYSTNQRIVISETDKLSDVVWKDDGSEFNVKFAVSFSVNDWGHRNTTVGVKTTWLESADDGKTYTETKTTDGTNGSIRNVSLDGSGKSEKLSNSLSVVSDKGLAESKAGMLYKVKIEVYTITGYSWNGYTYSRNPVITAETTPTAKLIYSSYVTFKNGDEKVVKEVPYGEKVTVDDPKAPQGKVFAGWYDGTDKDANLVDLKNTEITGPQTLYARFSEPEVTKYTVTFSHMYDGNKHHGKDIEKPVTVVESGKTVERPENDPTCGEDGHKFVDWYTDTTFATKFDFKNTKIEKDTTIWALWSYKVTFAVKRENGLPSTLTFDTPLNPTQVNCTFPVTSAIENINSITLGNGEYVIDGWQVGKKANYWSNNITYTDIDINTYKITENTNLYAKVKKVEKHDVTYYDGATPVHTDKVKDGDTYTIPEAYAKLTNTDSHKTFLGWFIDPECTKAYVAKEINANLDLYAGWKTEYTVKFDANGKTFVGSYDDQKVVKGNSINLPENVTEDSDKYDFTGWTLNGESVSGNYTVNSDVTFVANWKDKTVYHRVTFVAREGNDEDTPRHNFTDVIIEVEDGKLIDPSQIPEDPTCRYHHDHVFGGWYTSIDLSTPFDFKTMTITENIKIYSGWFTDTSIELNADEAKKNYTEGDTLDLTNVKILIKQKRVNGNYIVTSEIPVTAEMVTNFSTITKTAGNNKKVEVKYDGKTYSYTINVARKIINGSITLTDTKITKTYGTAPFAVGYKDATGAVSFESNNYKVAIVNEEGKIEIVGVGDATIKVKVAANGNYTATEAKVDLTVNPKQVSVVWDEETLVLPYNGDEQVPEVIVEGILEGDNCTVTVSGQKKNVGNDYVATVSVDSENYVIAEEDAEQSFSIVPKTVKVIWTNTELDYNGTEQGPDAALADGSICKGDEVNVTVSGKATNVGNEYVATASIDNDNYVILEDTASVDYSIAPKTVELVWSNTEFVYDGTEKKPSASINGELFGADKCNVTVTGSQTDAGKYTAYASLDNGNYEISDDFIEKEFVISPKEVKELTVTIGTLVCGTEIEPLVAEGMLRAFPMGLRFKQNWNNVTVKFSDEDAKYSGMFTIVGNLSEETASEFRLFTGKIEGGKNYMSGLQMSLDSNHVLASDAKVTVIYGNETLKAVDLTQFNSEKDLSDAFVSNSVMVFNSEEGIMIAANLLAVHVPGEAKRVDVAAATFEKEGQYDMVVSCTECETEISRESFPIAKLENNIEEVTFGGFDKVKKEYLINDELDVTGLTVTVRMSDGTVTTKDVTKDMVSGFNSKVENNALVLSVSYSGKAANYTVSVSEPAGEYVVEGDTKFNGKDNMKLHIIHTNAKRNAGLFAQFGGLDMDGKVVAKANYDATNGSIKLDIHSDYLKTLSEGEHNLTVEIGEDKVDVKITITKVQEEVTEPTQPAQQAATSDNAPSTGDTGSLVLWYVIALIALLSAAALAVARQKSRREEF